MIIDSDYNDNTTQQKRKAIIKRNLINPLSIPITMNGLKKRLS